MKKIVIAFLILIAGFLSLFKFDLLLHSFIINEIKKEVDLEIKHGFSIRKIANLLKEKNVIKNAILFEWYLRIFKPKIKLKAGKYRISPGKSFSQILNLLKKGSNEYIKVIIKEGSTLNDIDNTFFKAKVLKRGEFLKAAKKFKYKLVPENIKFLKPEGIFFPDTYKIRKDQSVHEILIQMYKRFKKVFYKLVKKYPSNLKNSEILIIASIVEKESQTESEKPIIASVFLNRLRKNMPLESCTTVLYALNAHKLLRKHDLKINSPYNTYIHKGLPPSPICAPGASSIKAVLNPAKSNFLYFVAKGDGTHAFAKSLREHMRNRRKYLKKFKKIFRKYKKKKRRK